MQASDYNLDEVPEADINQFLDKLRESLNRPATQPIPPTVTALATTFTVCHVSQQQLFSVSSADGKGHAVHLFPKETCTCLASNHCCHIITAMRSIGMPIERDRKVTKLVNLRTNTRWGYVIICTQLLRLTCTWASLNGVVWYLVSLTKFIDIGLFSAWTFPNLIRCNEKDYSYMLCIWQQEESR